MAKTEIKYTDPETWQRRYNAAASSQEQMFAKWDEWYKMMYAIRDDRNMAKWRSKVHIPIMSTKAWNLIAKFVQQEPGFEVNVRNDDDNSLDTATLENIADKVQRKLEFDYHNPELTESIRDKLTTCLVDAVVTGTGVAKIPWVMKKKKTYAHPTSNGDVDYEQDIVNTDAIGYNDLDPVNIFNVFVAPTAVSLQQAPWVIIREFKSLAELKAVNENYGIEIYKNLDALKGVRASSDRWAQYSKSRQNLTSDQDPVSADQTISLVEIFECYDRDKGSICTFAAESNDKGAKRWLTIREQQNPYWHGKFPLVSFYVRKRPYSFWGESIFETTQRLQAAANDIFNHYMDNWNLSVDGGIMIDENSQVAEFLVEPGFELVYSGEAPKQFKFPEPNPNQLTLVMTEIEKAVENATISNYATGTPISGLDKTQGTARGTMAILEAATDMIQFMRDNFMSSVKQIGEMWVSNNRQFMNFEFPVPVLKNNKFEIEPLTPEELQLQMELRINDMAMQPISDQQRKENYLAYLQQIIQAQTASVTQSQITGDQNQIVFLDWHLIMEQLGRHFHVKSFQKQIMPNEQALAAQNEAMAAEQQAMAADQEQRDSVDTMMAEVAELPDEDKLLAAEEAMANLEAVGGQ